MSFSLTIGIKPRLNKFSNVLLHLKTFFFLLYLPKLIKFGKYLSHLEKFENKFISSIWPIEAMAWLLSSLRFFLLKFILMHPRAIDPELLLQSFYSFFNC